VVHGLAIVRTIGCDRSDRTRDLIKQWTDLRGIAILGGRQFRSKDLTSIRVSSKV
jgi:hypothetical protein